MRWLIRVVAVTSIAVSIALVVPQIVFRWSEGPYTVFAVSLNATIAVAYVAVGWLIAARRPGNPIGPILVAIGAMYALGALADQYLSLPEVIGSEDLINRVQDPGRYALTHDIASVAALFLASLGYPIGVLGSLAMILFPDGRLLSRRWRWAVPAALLVLVIGIVGVVFSDRSILIAWPTYRSPLAIADFPSQTLALIADRLALALTFAVSIALFLRWRRNDPVERAQIKWVVGAVLVLVAATVVNISNEGREYDVQTAIVGLGPNIALALVVIAIGVAILRYRLYDIDRIVSRTLSYGAVTAILALVFALVGGGLGIALGQLVEGQTIAVAASTLLVVALFGPLRRRAQTIVDRRFDRSRYDASLTVEAMTERLRDDVDLARVEADVLGVVDRTFHPAMAGVWLRGASR